MTQVGCLKKRHKTIIIQDYLAEMASYSQATR